METAKAEHPAETRAIVDGSVRFGADGYAALISTSFLAVPVSEQLLHRADPASFRDSITVVLPGTVAIAEIAEKIPASKNKVWPHFQRDHPWRACLRKYSCFFFSEIMVVYLHPASSKGAYASSRTWRRAAMDASMSLDERH